MGICIVRPQTPEDKAQVYGFLYRIWTSEFSWEPPGTDHARQEIQDDLDPLAQHFVALDDKGTLVGCARINRVSGRIRETALFENMGFDNLSRLFGPEQVAFISRLAIDPAHRGGTVISLLLADLFCHLFESRITVATCYCRMNLVHLYHRIGMRPYMKSFRMNAGIRVPLIGCINDGPYLSKIKSPLQHLLPKECNDNGWAADLIRDHFPGFGDPELAAMGPSSFWARLAFASPGEAPEENLKLFKGFSREDLDQIMKRLPRLRLDPNQVVQAGPQDEVFMGVVLKGALGVGVGNMPDPHMVYVISPGEPFGELPALTRTRQPALLLSLEESEVLLIPDNLFSRLGDKNPELTMGLYRNILWVLAHRMKLLLDELAHRITAQRGLPQDLKAPDPERLPKKAGPNRLESYHFDTLSDKDSEFKRLTAQARVAEKLELSVLKKIGLTDGDRVLDLGSGPGVTSMLLARNLPKSLILGIEPERELRNQAHKITQGIPNCRFLEGTGQAIPLEDDHVDFSYARLLFQHIPDPMETIREMIRVTRPGGTVCVMDVDDGTIFIHPESRQWQEIEKRVARAQAQFGGDRHVGRKLMGYFLETGLPRVRVDIVPVTTQMLGPDTFFDIVFGFKQQHLKRAKDWDEVTQNAFAGLKQSLGEKGAFASENIFAVHARVPELS